MKLIIDTDLNFPSDDFQALLLILSQQNWQLLGCCAAAGNTWAEEVEENIIRALNWAGKPDIPVARGRGYNAFATQHRWAQDLKRRGVRTFIGAHEKSDRPRLQSPSDLAERLTRESAPEFIARMANAHPQELELMCIGPLSNVAEALVLEPNLPHLLKKLYIMGACFEDNHTAGSSIDFNFWFDADSAQAVMRSGIPTLLLPMNICRTAHVDASFLQTVKSHSAGLSGYFVNDFIGMTIQHGDSMPLWDQLLALILIRPELMMCCRRGFVEVRTIQDVHRGLTTFTPHLSGTVEVVWEVDNALVFATMLHCLKRLQSINASSSLGDAPWKFGNLV